MSIIQGNAHTSAGGGGYQIERSLRFNSADTAYLNRTPSSAGNRKTWTWSGWAKRSKLGAQQGLIGCSVGTSDSTYMNLQFNSGDLLGLGLYTQYVLLTTQVFRDTSAWYHIVVSFDTTNATANSRCRMYINGAEITTFTTRNNPTLNADYGINAASQHDIGRSEYTNSTCLGGYLTEVNFIDGQALTPSDFGETDSATGVWKPKAFSGTYGTNGFYLKFADNSGTTAATLGKDYSGNGNNWTPNNFSVTAGAGNDSLVDSPTSYGTDTSVGGEVRGNYCTLNALVKPASVTLSNGNLDVTLSTSSGNRSIGSTFYQSTGSWYWESVATTVGNNSAGIGIANNSFVFGNEGGTGCYFYLSDGRKVINNVYSAYGASYVANDVIGVAFDATNGTITFYKNGSSQGQITGIPTGVLYAPFVCSNTSVTASVFVTNFGQRAFAYTAPSGFKALCTQNLPTPTIGATSTTQANDYFNAVTWSGDGSSNRAITGVGFSPDFTWIKVRNQAFFHRLTDSVRGVTKELYSNDTGAEFTQSQGLLSFDSDGFTVGTSTSYNGSGNTYVAWNWRGSDSAAVTNTAGTITSTVSANTTSGFSIVTYTGTGSNATVGHGLGVTPDMIIVKNRTNAGQFWAVGHTSLTSWANGVYLNSTAGQASATTLFNSTAPTSTVFSVGTSGDTNGSTHNMVAYCFDAVAGYSAFGSYTGNGSADGPFVYLGFRPAYVMVKRFTSTGIWEIIDAKRDPYNAADKSLRANASDAEATGVGPIDFLSNGFKLRGTGGNTNDSGTYLYAAFAESPFRYSLAR